MEWLSWGALEEMMGWFSLLVGGHGGDGEENGGYVRAGVEVEGIEGWILGKTYSCARCH